MDMDEAMNLPVVEMGGDTSIWEHAIDLGRAIDRLFPDSVDGYNLGEALAHPAPEGVDITQITTVALIRQGSKDYDEWIWEIGLADGSLWTLVGWCDFTGWSCRSGVNWYPRLADT